MSPNAERTKEKLEALIGDTDSSDECDSSKDKLLSAGKFTAIIKATCLGSGQAMVRQFGSGIRTVVPPPILIWKVSREVTGCDHSMQE